MLRKELLPISFGTSDTPLVAPWTKPDLFKIQADFFSRFRFNLFDEAAGCLRLILVKNRVKSCWDSDCLRLSLKQLIVWEEDTSIFCRLNLVEAQLFFEILRCLRFSCWGRCQWVHRERVPPIFPSSSCTGWFSLCCKSKMSSKAHSCSGRLGSYIQVGLG